MRFQIKTGHPARDILAARYSDAASAIRNAKRQVDEREVDSAAVIDTDQVSRAYWIWRGLDGQIREEIYSREVR